MYRLTPAIFFGTPAAAAVAGPSEKQIYNAFRAHLRKAVGYRVEVWNLDEKGLKPQFAESILVDSRRGFRMTDRHGLSGVGNGHKPWFRRSEVADDLPRDNEGRPDYLELYVGKDRLGPTSFGSELSTVTFDGRRCFKLDPVYGENVSTAAVVYVDAKTDLLAGYSESFQGNWRVTYAFRGLKLNPKTSQKDFFLPK